ncbi:hypothetical protein CU072_27760 [Bacillus thuringiensis]|uniref:GTP pyrophosphokinase n=1 Tax=Bacillus thuringiensis TaxID=1428 RepID=UPI000D6C1293|nr:hypothetical protein [Bacillus thuringiensis]PWN12157.1 hypothetical protein CU072_27760 [Bacillus thuringiensis]
MSVRQVEIKEKNVKVNTAVEWYQKNRDFYKRLALKVELIIKEILEDCKIPFHDVTSRAKDIESFAEKAAKDKYVNPISEILDMAGIRITAYVESDVNKICEVIEREFNIIPEHSVNKSEILKYNEVGYRSVHYVAKLNDTRANLPEYRRLGAPFEIQVRTILQHAWAEIEHDRGYKFEGAELPEHAQIKRRFALLAGMLESADREFDSIVKDIAQYGMQVTEDTKNGNLDIPIDSISLINYLTNKFEHSSKYIEDYLGSDSGLLVHELLDFGMKKLSDLDSEINKVDIMEVARQNELMFNEKLTFTAILRLLMLQVDANKYFDKVYRETWTATEDSRIVEFIEKNGVSREELKKRQVIA